MKQVFNKEAQEGSLNSKWLTAAVLVLSFVFTAVSEETAQEPQQTDPNAPSKVIRGYKVDTSRRDEEGNFVRTPVYTDSNEVPPSAKSATKPPTIIPDTGLQRVVADIGPEVYSFKYEEPDIEEEGIFYGVRFGYTVHDMVPASPKEPPSERGMMFRTEGRVAFGQVDYDGALMGGTPYKINNIDDFSFEGRFLLGADMLHGEILSTIYSGIGYRYLNDDLSFDPSGYERVSNYFYVPVGYQLDSCRKAGWSLGFGAEFDVFITGTQRSYLSDVDPILPDIDNDQNSGYGYRASLRLKNKSKDAIFMVEPFFRFWDIDKSDLAYGLLYEPANETTEIGIQLFWIF